MMLRARLGRLEFVGGQRIELSARSILVIVGPNNSGKSAILNAIRQTLSGDQSIAQSALVDFTLIKETSLQSIREHLKPYKTLLGHYDLKVRFSANFDDGVLAMWWNKDGKNIGPFLAGQIVSDLATKVRLSDCDPPKVFDARNALSAAHPFQRMYREPDLETATSTVFRRAFKQDLILHRGAGEVIPLYVGDRPSFGQGEDRVSRSYLDRVEQLAELADQGDGVRSFVSIASRVITENRGILLIDEPEAFLHPPQAKLIAESVASFEGDRQTLVATHSSDVLQGLLSEHADRVSVVRLTRQPGGATASYLQSEKVAQLWRDPILRFSNILDGLFHDAVVITEADADCRFYETLANVVAKPEHRPDIHYTYSGGKDRLPIVIAALKGLEVPVATIVDFDVLNNEQPLRRIVEAHRGSWEDIQKDWLIFKGAVESKAEFLGGDQFRRDVQAELEQYGRGAVVPKEVLSRIRSLTRRASPWDRVKDAGMAAIPAGEPTILAKRLLLTLQRMGVFVAPHGQMEGFCRTIGGHGPRWVEQALERDTASDPELDAARTFVAQIVKFLRSEGGIKKAGVAG